MKPNPKSIIAAILILSLSILLATAIYTTGWNSQTTPTNSTLSNLIPANSTWTCYETPNGSFIYYEHNNTYNENHTVPANGTYHVYYPPVHEENIILPPPPPPI